MRFAGIRYEAAGRHWHSLALTTAICWGVANRNEAGAGGDGTSDNRVYRFLMASIGTGAILAVKRLPPLRVFRKPRWLILLAVATAGLFGNFILFSSSLQYLSPTASAGDWATLASWHDGCQRIYPQRENAQHSGCRGIDAPERHGDVFNTSLVEIFTKLTDYTRELSLGSVRRRFG